MTQSDESSLGFTTLRPVQFRFGSHSVSHLNRRPSIDCHLLFKGWETPLVLACTELKTDLTLSVLTVYLSCHSLSLCVHRSTGSVTDTCVLAEHRLTTDPHSVL